MKELNLNEIHEVTLCLLKQVRTLCDRLGIKYYIAYGTLLGAVRHKGFIPWDDDSDIWMLRADYELFFEYLKTHKDELYPLSYCSRLDTQDYTYAINRVTDKRYKYFDTVRSIEMDYGVFIDIYPLDFVGNDPKVYLNNYNKINVLNILYTIYVDDIAYSKSFLKSIGKRIIHILLHLVFSDSKDFLSFIEKRTKNIIYSYNSLDSKLLGVVIWWAYRQTYDKYLFEDTTMIEFEGEFFSAPKHYKELLTLIYGDYMKLPPIEKRAPYHGYKIYERNS